MAAPDASDQGSRSVRSGTPSSAQASFRVDRMASVEPTGEPVLRPEGFELAAAWPMITHEVDRRRTSVLAHALARSDAVWICRSVFGNRVKIGPPAPKGGSKSSSGGHSARSLAAEVAGLGAMLEVLDPSEVREALATIAGEFAGLYRDGR